MSLADFLQLYLMPQLSDVLKNKSHGETPLEKQQRLQIEAEIADRARKEEEAALEAEQQIEILDIVRALEEEEAIIEPVIEPMKIPKPPIKRKKKDTAAEKRAKEAAKKRK